jgi:branched-chain amino acid transport system permease protein
MALPGGHLPDHLPQAISRSRNFARRHGPGAGPQGCDLRRGADRFVLFEPMGLYGRWLKIRTYLQLFPFYRKGMFKRQKSFQKSDSLK